MKKSWKIVAAMGMATTIMTAPMTINGTKDVQVAQAATKTTAITYMGQIDNPKTAIYDAPAGNKFDTVDTLYSKNSFYVHKKAVVNGVTYYRISRNENPTFGAIGWVKASTINVKKMTEQKNVVKAYPMNGKGNAYSRPDGGERNSWHSLKDYKNRQFYPQRTVKVGTAIWYYGKVGARNVWISADSLSEKVDTAGATTEATNVSYMGMLHSTANVIYKTAGGAKLQTAGTLYTENNFYVHQKKIVNGVTYYRISRNESASSEAVGWVKSAAIELASLKAHANVTENFKLTGKGNAYSRPAGGERNIWHSLKTYKNTNFRAKETVEVNGELWYYGTVGVRNVWVSAASVTDSITQTGNTATSKITAVSYVGQAKSAKTPIFRVAGKSSTKFLAGKSYTNETFYIYKKNVVKNTIYYEIRRSQSGDIIGWVKDKSLAKQTLKFTINTKDSFTIDGTGKGYTRPNGKSRNILYTTMKPFAGDTFKPTSTAIIGNDTWYVGQLGTKTGWVKASQVTKIK